MLTIFGDYITAHSIISIALLGIALGGLIEALAVAKVPLQSIIAASMLLPFCLLMAFGDWYETSVTKKMRRSI